MLTKISEQFVSWQIERGTLKKEEKAIYQYAYEVLLSQVINIVLAGVVAGLFKDPLTVFVFLFAYMPLRSFCGGFHANNHLSCSIISAVILGIVCFLVNEITSINSTFWYPLTFAVSGFVIFTMAPIQDKNKPLDFAEVQRYGKISKLLWLSEAMAGIGLYFYVYEQGVVLALCHCIITIMLILGRIKNRILTDRD